MTDTSRSGLAGLHCAATLLRIWTYLRTLRGHRNTSCMSPSDKDTICRHNNNSCYAVSGCWWWWAVLLKKVTITSLFVNGNLKNSKVYFATRYRPWKKLPLFCYSLLGPEKCYQYFVVLHKLFFAFLFCFAKNEHWQNFNHLCVRFSALSIIYVMYYSLFIE